MLALISSVHGVTNHTDSSGGRDEIPAKYRYAGTNVLIPLAIVFAEGPPRNATCTQSLVTRRSAEGYEGRDAPLIWGRGRKVSISSH